MKLIGPRHSTKRFTFSNKVFVAELSDFKGTRIEDQLWDDSADVGFVLVSHKTGKEEAFYFSHDIRSKDYELQVLVYKQHRGELEVHFLND